MPNSELPICSQLSPPPFPTIGTTVPLSSRVPHHLRQHVLTPAHDSKQLWAGATPCRQNCCCPPPWPTLGPPSLPPWVQTTSTSAERTTMSIRTSSDRGSPELGKSALGRWILPLPGVGDTGSVMRQRDGLSQQGNNACLAVPSALPTMLTWFGGSSFYLTCCLSCVPMYARTTWASGKEAS